ncbi:hypothetical protein [Clostridium thermobutyricum]|uniref:hypothetical protein n=1 Tax=Clostridium thermobutyricum TaxID=29372 RepID=UPI00294336DB|nr:hypothetical protein [Clostridium thermobutyricum]
MIKIKIDKNSLNEPIFKLSINKEDILNNRFIKRVIYEGKTKRGMYNYEIPMKFFYPLLNNLKKDDVYIETRSNLSFLEFTDDFEEEFHYSIEATPKYMRKWREFNCPNIYKIELDKETLKLNKRVAFKKIEVAI